MLRLLRRQVYSEFLNTYSPIQLLKIQVPSNVSLEEAATIPVGIAVTVAGLYTSKPHGAGLVAPFESSERDREAGKPFLVFGGASSVGQYGACTSLHGTTDNR